MSEFGRGAGGRLDRLPNCPGLACLGCAGVSLRPCMIPFHHISRWRCFCC
jgi:hypothetical protein